MFYFRLCIPLLVPHMIRELASQVVHFMALSLLIIMKVLLNGS